MIKALFTRKRVYSRVDFLFFLFKIYPPDLGPLLDWRQGRRELPWWTARTLEDGRRGWRQGRQFFPGGLPGQAECHTPALAGLVNFLEYEDAVETNPYALALLRIRSTPHIVARWVCSSPVFSARLYAP